MSQRLSNWANIAEIVSGIAVVLTLVFLVLGIRENTEVTRASMFQRSTDRIIEWRRDVLSNSQLAESFQQYLDGRASEITGTGRTLITEHVLNQFQIYEQAYFSELSGLLGPAEWARFETQICNFYPRIQSAPFLVDTVFLAMTPEFSAYMRDSCKE
jgi:hypothetical protein